MDSLIPAVRTGAVGIFIFGDAINIPKQIQAGDTITWTDSLGDYLASAGWSLKYQLAASNRYTYTSTEDGDDHTFTITAAVSAKLVAGIYSYQAYVVKAAEEYTIEKGTVEILINLRTQKSGIDPRSHVKIVLDSLEDVIEQRVTAGYAAQQIGGLIGRSVNLDDPTVLHNLWTKYKRLYKKEQQAERRKQGLPAGNMILAEMSSGL